MAVERRFSPIAIAVHAVAIVCGLVLGWIVMDRITPDFPTGDPGLESSSEPQAVAGGDPDSLFLANNFNEAIGQMQDQFGVDQGVVSLHVEPGAFDVKTSGADGTFPLSDVPVSGPAQIAAQLHDLRERITLDDIGYMDLVATRKGPVWYVQLDINRTDVDPPWTYTAPLEGAPVAPGGPPEPIAG